MQLKTPVRITGKLAAMTAVVLGSTTALGASLNHSETSLLFYRESDRVRATAIIYDLTKQLRNNYTLGFKVTYDGLTGASPTGASPSKRAQTISRPSGGTQTVVPAGSIPIDEAFSETRFALDGSLTKQITPATRLSGELHLSTERDYLSRGINGGISQDFNSGSTTIGIMGGIAREKSKPKAGIPVPLDSVIQPGEGEEEDRNQNFSGKEKFVYDGLVSVSQQVGLRSLVRFSYSVNLSEGYLTDPYKIISEVLPLDSLDAGEPVRDRYERRPSTRLKHAVYGEFRTAIGGGTLGLGYRYFWDDWEIVSHTADISILVNAKKIGTFTPRARLYRQTRADFYKPFLVLGDAKPEFVSSDSRLGTFDALTAGLTYSKQVSPRSKINVTTEYYVQRGDQSPPEAFGPLVDMRLFPDLDAIMVRLGLSHDF